MALPGRLLLLFTSIFCEAGHFSEDKPYTRHRQMQYAHSSQFLHILAYAIIIMDIRSDYSCMSINLLMCFINSMLSDAVCIQLTPLIYSEATFRIRETLELRAIYRLIGKLCFSSSGHAGEKKERSNRRKPSCKHKYTSSYDKKKRA